MVLADMPTIDHILNPGDYMWLFRVISATAKCDLKLFVTYHIKTLRKLIDVGLALLEVAIPILITGFVVYAG